VQIFSLFPRLRRVMFFFLAFSWDYGCSFVLPFFFSPLVILSSFLVGLSDVIFKWLRGNAASVFFFIPVFPRVFPLESRQG